VSGPAVSVIMPALDAERFIGIALTSVLSQTFADLEVLVVDDGSRDGTAAAVERFATADRRVRLLRHDRTLGTARARNTAIANARGAWLAPLDADDAFAANRLEYLVGRAHALAADLVADNVMLCSFPSGDALEPAIRPGSALFNTALTPSAFIAHEHHGGFSLGYLKPLVRRAFIDEHRILYRSEVAVVEDFAFYLDCLLCGARLFLTPEPLYRYSVRFGSVSFDGTRRGLDHMARLNRDFLHSLPVQANAEWKRLFQTRQRRIEREISYALSVEAVRAGRIWHAVSMSCRRPLDLPYFAVHLFDAAKRRITGEAYRPRGMSG
jgi:glycosyltransferase involved in cell wall biosynthesis